MPSFSPCKFRRTLKMHLVTLCPGASAVLQGQCFSKSVIYKFQPFLQTPRWYAIAFAITLAQEILELRRMPFIYRNDKILNFTKGFWSLEGREKSTKNGSLFPPGYCVRRYYVHFICVRGSSDTFRGFSLFVSQQLNSALSPALQTRIERTRGADIGFHLLQPWVQEP